MIPTPYLNMMNKGQHQQDFNKSSHHPCFLNEARKTEIESDVQFVRSLPTISISTISIPKYSQSGRVAGTIVINITNKPVSASTSASPHQKNHKQGRLRHHACKYHFQNTSLYLLMKSSSEKKKKIFMIFHSEKRHSHKGAPSINHHPFGSRENGGRLVGKEWERACSRGVGDH